MAGMRQTDRQTDRRAGPGHQCVLSVSGLSEHDAELVLSVHACLHVLKPCPSHACARHRAAQLGRRSRLYQLSKAFNSRAFSVNASSSRLIFYYYHYVFQNKNKHCVLAVFSTSTMETSTNDYLQVLRESFSISANHRGVEKHSGPAPCSLCSLPTPELEHCVYYSWAAGLWQSTSQPARRHCTTLQSNQTVRLALNLSDLQQRRRQDVKLQQFRV